MSIKDKKIGFAGLGTMGKPMALNIHKAGFDLAVYNRSESKTEPFKEEGITVYQTPSELAEKCDIVIVMVTDPQALEMVMSGVGGLVNGLSKDKLVINMSTVSFEATRLAAGLTYEKSARFIDAPVSGSKKPAEDGSLIILAGGDKNLIDQTTPLFACMGSKTVYCGDVGSGTMMKLMINMLLGNMMASFCESLAFGSRMGLDWNAMTETIAGGALNSPLFQIKGQAIKENNFEKNFPVDLIFKDLNLVMDACGKIGLPMPITSATREVYSGAVGMELGDEDMAGVVKFYEKLADAKIIGGAK